MLDMSRRKRMTIAITVVAVLLAVPIAVKVLALVSAGMTVTLTLTADGTLPPARTTPNAVCTEPSHPKGDVKPLPLPRHTRGNTCRLLELLEANGCRVVTDDGTFIHATARTAIFGFVDDLAFRFDDDAQVVHCRFSSRVGKSGPWRQRRIGSRGFTRCGPPTTADRAV